MNTFMAILLMCTASGRFAPYCEEWARFESYQACLFTLQDTHGGYNDRWDNSQAWILRCIELPLQESSQ